MARYILIDNGSGFIFGDTADFTAGDSSDMTPAEAAERLDYSLGERNRSYEEVGRRTLASNETGYHVYRADVDGAEAVPVVDDGQDQDVIDAVERDCEYVTTIRVTEVEG
jgi:hypothetical protein